MTNMYAYVVKEDLERWETQGRYDIISHVQNGYIIWAGDRIISPISGSDLSVCPFLEIDNDTCRCSIYETRPGVCASYSPGSSPLCPQWDRYWKY
jgi:Fe-S-cluster containining protein